MTPREAYEEDVRRCPTYECGAPRKAWDQLSREVQAAWERNPTPREFKHLKGKREDETPFPDWKERGDYLPTTGRSKRAGPEAISNGSAGPTLFG